MQREQQFSQFYCHIAPDMIIGDEKVIMYSTILELGGGIGDTPEIGIILNRDEFNPYIWYSDIIGLPFNKGDSNKKDELFSVKFGISKVNPQTNEIITDNESIKEGNKLYRYY